jgi:hypothetical protein
VTRAALALLLTVMVVPTCIGASRTTYPLHTDITATVFWFGEPKGNGSSENNAVSAWDDDWLKHYGGVDDHRHVRKPKTGYFPAFTPKENPFYFDLPYNDFRSNGRPRKDRTSVVPWASDLQRELAASKRRGRPFSLLKNRWIRVMRGGKVCYAQWEDSGPYVYDDAAYVFGSDDRRPRSRRANNAGIDVSPAVRDCLNFKGLNNDQNKVDWQFVDRAAVPDGPWLRVLTTRQVAWHQ